MKSLPVIRFTFLMMSGVILAGLVVTWTIGREALRRSAEISAREGNLRELHEYFSLLLDAESGQRGFLLTLREEELQPYDDARAVLPERQGYFRKLARDGEIPMEETERLLGLSSERMAQLARAIDGARERGTPALADSMVSEDSRKKTGEIRTALSRLVAHEEKILGEAKQSWRRLTNIRTGTFAVVALINLGFLLWAYRRIRREVNRRHVADLEAQRQREILAVSLASIGDAVILTDVASRILFLNEVAEEVTGWKREEALGMPCAEVFRIVNETTHAVVESPVDLVLRTGKVVGLANHTLLVRKDGREVPIDDSGAPIREADGTIRGVVLVFRDFSVRRAAEREMSELKDRLETANRAKDEFIAALSHELRTPLTPVLATLSSWESDGSAPREFADDIQMLCRNVRLEVRLIDDLLDLTRISRGQLALRRETVDAHELLGATVEIFRDETEARRIRIGLHAAASRHFVDADPARLQQVFWNILGNAVKATPTGGRIEIVTANEDGEIRVTIADNGRGMSPGTLAHLFQPFERSKSSHTGYRPTGLGLGLTISQNLMRAHGGEIEARSPGEGLGAVFTVRMPALDHVEPARPDGNDAGPDAAARPLAVLLVEDHEDTAVVIGRIVSNMGHNVRIARTMTEALDRLRSEKFDIVLSDIGLPDGTGIELLEKTRAFSQVPMIALTGYGMEDDLQRYREAGFLHQLTKPIDFEQLQRMLREFGATLA
jgi:PAS domain S-box-containing protein